MKVELKGNIGSAKAKVIDIADEVHGIKTQLDKTQLDITKSRCAGPARTRIESQWRGNNSAEGEGRRTAGGDEGDEAA